MKLNYKTYGHAKPTLLILHGMLGSLDNWQTLARRWSDHFTVIVPDLRNHGRSPHANIMDYGIMTNDIHEFCEELQLANFFILGHSMGGKVAMTFALQYPEKVSGVIIADIGPVTYQSGHDAIFQAMESLPLDSIKDRQEADDLLALSISSYGIRQFILKNLSRKENDGYEWKLNLAAIVTHYEALMGFEAKGHFDGPALFMKGSQSDYIQQQDWPAYRLFFPSANLVEVQGAGHWIHAEKPEIVYETVRNFILEYS